MAGQRKKSDSATLEQVPPANPIRSALHWKQRSRSPLATEAGRGTNLAAVFIAALLSPASTASQEEQNNHGTPAKKEATIETFIHHEGLHHPNKTSIAPPPPLTTTVGQKEEQQQESIPDQRVGETGLIREDPVPGTARHLLRPPKADASAARPPDAPVPAKKHWRPTPIYLQTAEKQKPTPILYSSTSPPPSPAGKAAGKGSGSSRSNLVRTAVVAARPGRRSPAGCSPALSTPGRLVSAPAVPSLAAGLRRARPTSRASAACRSPPVALPAAHPPEFPGRRPGRLSAASSSRSTTFDRELDPIPI
nr:uncharacterized protein LOC127347216 [Lolium perenne]